MASALETVAAPPGESLPSLGSFVSQVSAEVLAAAGTVRSSDGASMVVTPTIVRVAATDRQAAAGPGRWTPTGPPGARWVGTARRASPSDSSIVDTRPALARCFPRLGR